MKKIALMLAFLMTAGILTGCGEESSSDEKSSSSQVQENDNSDESSLSSEAQSANTEFERGKVENNVYTSNFADIKFAAPEGWEFADDEYIASLMNIGLEITEKDNDLTKAMLEQTTIYDTMCIEASTGKNIIIMYENLAKEVLNPEDFTAEDYMDAVEGQLNSTANITFATEGGRENITINGKEYIKQTISTKYDQAGMETSQVYYVRKVDNFMLAIIASSGNTSDDMTVYEENFEK